MDPTCPNMDPKSPGWTQLDPGAQTPRMDTTCNRVDLTWPKSLNAIGWTENAPEWTQYAPRPSPNATRPELLQHRPYLPQDLKCPQTDRNYLKFTHAERNPTYPKVDTTRLKGLNYPAVDPIHLVYPYPVDVTDQTPLLWCVDTLVVGSHPRLDGEEQHLQVALLLKPEPARAQPVASTGAQHGQEVWEKCLLGWLLHRAVGAEGLQLVLHTSQ